MFKILIKINSCFQIQIKLYIEYIIVTNKNFLFDQYLIFLFIIRKNLNLNIIISQFINNQIKNESLIY
jgi:hypothetical protein